MWCPVLFLLLVICFPAAPNLPAQGTRADYERAAARRKLTENKVFKATVKPHWFADNTRFWYRNDLAEGAREFLLVDATNGLRRPAFDHQRLAAALAATTGQEVKPDHLPLEDLDFSAREPLLTFRSGEKSWSCDLAAYTLRPATNQPSAEPGLPAQDAPHPSRRTGPESAITFDNRTAADVNLFWIDPDGERRSYGAVKAGQQRVQHTFGGHVWLVTTDVGKTYVFEATDTPAAAIIDGKPPAKARDDSVPRRSSRRPRSAGAESPDGQWFASVKDFNLQIRSVAEGEEFSLSTDGSADDEYAGLIYWSPDSKKLVALRAKKGDDRKVYYVESSPKDQLQPKLHSYNYLKPGDRIPQPKPQLFDLGQRKHIPVSDALFAHPWSLTEVRWSMDSRRFTFLYNQRGHQVLRLVAVEAATGSARAIIDEQSPTFIDYAGKYFLHYLEGASELLWMSERDGWNHLYLYNAETGAVKNQITKGEWVVRGVEKVDEAKRQVWFRAGGIRPGQDPCYIHCARVNFDGSGLTLLTEGDGTHTVAFSPDRRFFLDTWSRVDFPPVTELRRAEDGARICPLEQADARALLDTGWKPPERFVAKGRDGQTDIFGIIIPPARYDPNKQYPVIEEIYAGPQGSFVPKTFRPAYSTMHALAELGFFVVKMDGMGTSERSKKFHDVCWKNLGDSGFPDRIPWIKAAAAKHPGMDLTRVGIYGGSAGGQSALRALLAHGDFYKVAVADCGCHDNRMDKIWWNELWMGWPVGPHYEEQSNVTQAHRLQGKLLLFVGEMDENVDPASTMQVANALIKADKDFDLVIMTGRGHGSAETDYGRRRRADFFVRHLLGIEPRGK
jgi:dipeptidyl aminopeptidase/acylaminoacyl peptidase